MAEKILQTAPSDYISVIVNFKNLRFMTLIKENYLISDLIREVENTFAKLCSVKVKIKTLKNSVNAVLPDWYPVAPLIRNQDEIFAFTDNAAEVLNIDLTKHGNCGSIAVSPLGSGIMPDSGFTSPIVKPRTFRGSDGPLERKGMDGDGVERQKRSDENFSQDEGNELLSEIFSLQDHKNDMQVRGQGKKLVGNLRTNTTDSEKERESSLEVEQARKTFGKTQKTKTAGKNFQETTTSPRNEIMDKSPNEPDSLVGQEKTVKNSFDDNQGKKEVYKSKKKTVASDSESSSDSSSESSWKSNECTNKAHEIKNASQQNKSSQNNDNVESFGAARKAKETEKASEVTKSTGSAQNKGGTQKLNIKRKNGSFNMRAKLFQENNIQGAAGHESDSSDDSTDNEEMDVDKKHGNKNIKLALSSRKRAKVSGEKNDENMEVDAENVTKENSELVSKTGKVKSAANTGNKESESSDSSLVVDEGGGGGSSKEKAKTTGVESKEIENGKDASAKVSAKKGKKIGEKTMIADEQDDCNKITGKKTDDSKNRKGKETKASETSTPTKSSGNAIPKIMFINDKDMQESSSDDESAVGTQEGKTKKVKGEMSASNKKDHTGKESMKNESKGDTKKLDTKSGTAKKDQSRKDESSSDSSGSSSDSDEREPSKKPKNNNEKKNDNAFKNRIKVMDITMKDTAKETENVKETNVGKKDENNDVKKAKPDEESDLTSVSDSSWSSSDDEDKEVKTTNVKTLKNKNETATRAVKDESPTDVVDGVKSKSKNDNPTTPAPKSISKGGVEDNTTKVKGKRKDAVKNDDKDKQTNLDAAPSPAKSVRHKKSKENSNKNTFASPAKSIARSKKGGLSKTNADEAKDTEVDAKSESSVSTLKAPYTQLPAKDKAKGHSESGGSDDDAVKKGKEILKVGKKKGKHNSTDKKTGHVVTTSADQIEPKDPKTSILFPQTPTTRKKAALLSASKVASWLLSNPVTEDVADVTSNETKSPQTRSKNKTKDNITNLLEPTNNETALKPPKKNSKNKSKENVPKVESIVDKIDSDKTLLSPKGATLSQKRKLDEVSEQEQSIKSKKNKKKKSEGKKNEKQQLNEETQGAEIECKRTEIECDTHSNRSYGTDLFFCETTFLFSCKQNKNIILMKPVFEKDTKLSLFSSPRMKQLTCDCKLIIEKKL
ncbi:Hypothetical predicted protein [Paramuricea clavata]|uniref:Uncharacterized protein n=1 Tax=Paramuricea clavata TaxID=317549 RepID=A0A6S7IRX1_PARCT|nr:Hypothetical predicted protein [Paramuricea clavata]